MFQAPNEIAIYKKTRKKSWEKKSLKKNSTGKLKQENRYFMCLKNDNFAKMKMDEHRFDELKTDKN